MSFENFSSKGKSSLSCGSAAVADGLEVAGDSSRAFGPWIGIVNKYERIIITTTPIHPNHGNHNHLKLKADIHHEGSAMLASKGAVTTSPDATKVFQNFRTN